MKIWCVMDLTAVQIIQVAIGGLGRATLTYILAKIKRAGDDGFQVRCLENQKPIHHRINESNNNIADLRAEFAAISERIRHISESPIYNGGFDRVENDIAATKNMLENFLSKKTTE